MPKLTKPFLAFANKVFDHMCENYTNDCSYHMLTSNAIEAAGRRVNDSDSGAYRTAFIFKDGVIKVSTYGTGLKRLRQEADFIQKMRRSRKFAKHFPDTQVLERVKKIGGRQVYIAIQLQEPVKNIANYRLVDKWGPYAEDLGEFLGISDIHSMNYGWAGPKGKEYPVFIDVDFRSRPRKKVKRPAWAV